MGVCIEMAREPLAWNAFLTLLGIGCLALSTWKMTQSCYYVVLDADDDVAQMSASANCNRLAHDYSNKWSIFFVLSLFAIAVAASQTCIGACSTVKARMFRRTQGAQVVQSQEGSNDALSLTCGAVMCASVTIYMHFVIVHLNRLPSTEAAAKAADSCLVCPAAHSPVYRIMMWAGFLCMWSGFVLVAVAIACFGRRVRAQKAHGLREMLTIPQDRRQPYRDRTPSSSSADSLESRDPYTVKQESKA